MNLQVQEILKKLIQEYKQDQKCYLDEVEKLMATDLSAWAAQFDILNKCMNHMTENQTMIRTLLERLYP